MEVFDFFIIFSPAWLMVSFLLYWPFFFRFAREGVAKNIIAIRLYGALLFGGVPIVISLILGYSLKDTLGLKLDFGESPVIWLISLGIALFITVINYFASKSQANLKEFPQIRDKRWTIKIYVGNIISWSIYLIGYEILFRGIMVFPLMEKLGLWPVVIIGTAFYSLSHYPKNIREAIGAIPLGVIMVLIAWKTQSVWPCILIHISLALSNSLWSLKHHPEISLSRKTKL